jgi:hypothetical protein
MSSDFRLLMLGAMYENGGNTTHRFLDGHPQLYTYPFESQVGTRLVNDALSSMFPVKYRWPTFALDATPAQDYHAIIDEEGKVRARTPFVSKFRDYPFELSDEERRARYEDLIAESGRSAAANVEAFFRATFDVWHDRAASGRESVYVGYSPILVVDADKILESMPGAHFLHVVRNPWSAYADTKKRPVPLGLADYMLGWSLNQHAAFIAQERFPDRFHLVRTEDVLADSVATLGAVCEKMGLRSSETLGTPTWNGNKLDQVYPWGTIRIPTPAANRATAAELSPAEQDEIRLRTAPFADKLGYTNFLSAG